jgi:hypothetical protein
VKIKVMTLVFLVILAAFVSSLAVGLSSRQIFGEKIGFHESYSIVQIGFNDTEPQGEPIACPEMPG